MNYIASAGKIEEVGSQQTKKYQEDVKIGQRQILAAIPLS